MNEFPLTQFQKWLRDSYSGSSTRQYLAYTRRILRALAKIDPEWPDQLDQLPVETLQEALDTIPATMQPPAEAAWRAFAAFILATDPETPARITVPTSKPRGGLNRDHIDPKIVACAWVIYTFPTGYRVSFEALASMKWDAPKFVPTLPAVVRVPAPGTTLDEPGAHSRWDMPAAVAAWRRLREHAELHGSPYVVSTASGAEVRGWRLQREIGAFERRLTDPASWEGIEDARPLDLTPSMVVPRRGRVARPRVVLESTNEPYWPPKPTRGYMCTRSMGAVFLTPDGMRCMQSEESPHVCAAIEGEPVA